MGWWGWRWCGRGCRCSGRPWRPCRPRWWRGWRRGGESLDNPLLILLLPVGPRHLLISACQPERAGEGRYGPGQQCDIGAVEPAGAEQRQRPPDAVAVDPGDTKLVRRPLRRDHLPEASAPVRHPACLLRQDRQRAWAPHHLRKPREVRTEELELQRASEVAGGAPDPSACCRHARDWVGDVPAGTGDLARGRERTNQPRIQVLDAARLGYRPLEVLEHPAVRVR